MALTHRIRQILTHSRRIGWLAGILGAVLLALLVDGPLHSAGVHERPAPPGIDHRTSANNLKQLVLAFHNYADAMGQMPPAVVYGKDGKALYSWRVLILPYLEEQKLFDAFHKDEAWDSRHNKKLLSRMPKVFNPGGKAGKKYETFYQVFVGPATPFRDKDRGPRIPTTFLDGTSNTFLVVEAGKAVPWSAPQDVVYEAARAVPQLGGLLKDGFNVGLADGSVRFYEKGKLSDEMLRAAITPDGGEALGDGILDRGSLPGANRRARER